MRVILYFFVFCFISATAFSQNIPKIKFQKNSTQVYFFPKNLKNDSVIQKPNDLFYLLVPDSLKKHVFIYVENGQLLKTANDSIVRINYTPGLKYEAQYIIREIPSEETGKLKKVFDLITLINGVSEWPKDKIQIRLFNKKEEKIIIENSYIYKN